MLSSFRTPTPRIAKSNSRNATRRFADTSQNRAHRRRNLCVEPLENRLVLDSTVVFNEIMYNLPGLDDGLEWIELQNQLSVDMDISQWSIEGGVDYEFAEGTVVPGRGYLIIAADAAAFEVATGVAGAQGPFVGQLSNGGEELRLINNSGRVMSRVDYGDSGEWPVGPDGSGASLARTSDTANVELPENWTHSVQLGGTPGSENFPPPPEFEALVEHGDPARLTVPSSTDDLMFNAVAWNEQNFDDANAPGWVDVDVGVGFDSTGTGVLDEFIDPQGDIQAIMQGQNATSLVRVPFHVSDVASLTNLELRTVYNDGFVAYLNGTEVARENAQAGSLSYNAAASGSVGSGPPALINTYGPSNIVASASSILVNSSLYTPNHMVDGTGFSGTAPNFLDSDGDGFPEHGTNPDGDMWVNGGNNLGSLPINREWARFFVGPKLFANEDASLELQ